MTIIVTKTPDIHITEDELGRYRREYQQAYSMYAGVPPSFETFVAKRLSKKRRALKPTAATETAP